MPAETARTIFFVMAAVMWIVWYLGTRFALSRVRPGRAETGPPAGILENHPSAAGC